MPQLTEPVPAWRRAARALGFVALAFPALIALPFFAVFWALDVREPGLDCSGLETLIQEAGYCAAFPAAWDDVAMASRPYQGRPNHAFAYDCPALSALAVNIGIPSSLLMNAGDFMASRDTNARHFFKTDRRIDLCDYGRQAGWIGYDGDLSALSRP